MSDIDMRPTESTETQTSEVANVAIQKIERAIFEKYHVSLIECRKDPFKLDAILREIFGADHIVLEKTILENVLSLEQSTEMDNEWITIHDKSLTRIVLDTLADKDKKKILAIASDKLNIIAKIVDTSGVPENVAYRKIDELIRDGMLIARGAINTSDGRQIKKYVGVFKNLKSGMVENQITIKAKLSKEALETSHIIALLQSVQNKTETIRQEIQLQ
ncbi:MAG TPA: hypothetical protein VJJ25_00190 [Nitrosopumilaceae archaeon]|nr:hypothetical protein [Nitrosopumilaceae archaeon]